MSLKGLKIVKKKSEEQNSNKKEEQIKILWGHDFEKNQKFNTYLKKEGYKQEEINNFIDKEYFSKIFDTKIIKLKFSDKELIKNAENHYEKIKEKYFQFIKTNDKRVTIEKQSVQIFLYLFNNFIKENEKRLKRIKLYSSEIKDNNIYDLIEYELHNFNSLIQQNKEITMEYLLGIIKTLNFVSKQILGEGAYYLLSSIPKINEKNKKTNQIIKTYSIMNKGHLLETYSLMKNTQSNKRDKYIHFDIKDWNNEVNNTIDNAKQQEKEIEITRCPSMDMRIDNKFIEIKHFTENEHNEFNIHIKNPKHQMAKIKNIKKYKDFRKKITKEEIEYIYQINVYDNNMLSIFNITFEKYEKLLEVIGEILKKELEKNKNTQEIRIGNIYINIKMDLMVGQNIPQENIFTNSENQGIKKIKFAFKTPEDYKRLLLIAGAEEEQLKKKYKEKIKKMQKQ